MLTETHISILRDIAVNKISLDEDTTDWMRERLVELALNDPMLIDARGPSVFLTEAGKAALASTERNND